MENKEKKTKRDVIEVIAENGLESFIEDWEKLAGEVQEIVKSSEGVNPSKAVIMLYDVLKDYPEKLEEILDPLKAASLSCKKVLYLQKFISEKGLSSEFQSFVKEEMSKNNTSRETATAEAPQEVRAPEYHQDSSFPEEENPEPEPGVNTASQRLYTENYGQGQYYNEDYNMSVQPQSQYASVPPNELTQSERAKAEYNRRKEAAVNDDTPLPML